MLSTYFVGVAIFYLLWAYSWQNGRSLLQTQYSAHSVCQIQGELVVNVGLDGAEVRLAGNLSGGQKNMVDYVEVLSWQQVLRDEETPLKQALVKGSPYPVLTVMDYLTKAEFPYWGKDFNTAGYYTNAILWSALILWLMHILVDWIDAFYSHYFLFGTGCLLLVSPLTYSLLVPWRSLGIPFDTNWLVLKYGASFYTSVMLGLVCLWMSIWQISTGSNPTTEWAGLESWFPQTRCRRYG